MDLNLDLNVPNSYGAFPLHVATSSLSPGLIELFLYHGAEANIRCNAVDSENKHGLLPLHIALERASSADKCLSHWTPKHSIFKLIIMLCLPEMKEAMETCRLLALNTKDIKEVICSYVKEGKFIELAILMMVARKKVMDPITLQSKDGLTLKECMTFRQWVKSELAALIDEEYFFMGMKEEKQLIRTRKEKKVAMISTLLLVEIFERVGDTFEAYLQSKQNVPKEHVAGEIAWLLAEAGFILNCKDVDLSDVFDSWQTNLVLERSGGPFHEDEEHSERKICDSQQDHICNQPYSPPGSSLDTNGWSSQRDEDIGSNVEHHQIMELIARDDEDKFVPLIKGQLENDNSDNGNSNFGLMELMMWICHYRAVKCAFGLIGGATGQTMDLNVPLKDGLYPLHHAAQSLSSGLTKLFIQHGAKADVRCNDVGSKFYGLLPLDVAVESICCRIEWTPKQSVFRLLFTLCNSNLNESLETVSMLSVRTREVDDVLYHYAKEGKLVQLAALLMVAPDTNAPPTKDDGSIALRRVVASEIASLIDTEHMFLGHRSRKQAKMLKEKKRVMSTVMLLVEILQRTAGSIKSDARSRNKVVYYYFLSSCGLVGK
uniref:Uncharacterized protein n=1 Tax=Davidia involucrata TaxID=16924 RepID=A0A5B7AYL2_DAVIN